MAEVNQLDGYEKIDLYNYKNVDKLASYYKGVLKLIGEDPEREGLKKTPERVAKSIQFLTHGYLMDPVEILNSAKFKEDYREMVIVKDIEIYSLCEHHMIPF
ncbi:MAG: GTP cyclohydrolase I, partial [Bacteroidales bacterium]|nr:GTP cyclohydrolase I [Bacteroidales bacterium]